MIRAGVGIYNAFFGFSGFYYNHSLVELFFGPFFGLPVLRCLRSPNSYVGWRAAWVCFSKGVVMLNCSVVDIQWGYPRFLKRERHV